MNRLEQIIYTRGLEATYRHALLGEDAQVLNCLEHLVYLTRKLNDGAPVKQSMAEEVSFLRRICMTCWPEMALHIQLETGTEYIQAERGQVSVQICDALLALTLQGESPDLIELRMDGDTLCYHISRRGVACSQGVILDE